MRRKDFTIYNIVTALLEEAILAAVVIWLLPQWGINIPIWGLILMMVALGAYNFITYKLGKRALDRKPTASLEAMVGCSGEAATPLAPKGYVQVKGELWRALSTERNIDKGEEVVVVEIKKLTLLVKPLPDSSCEVSE
ncbi:hypothetical protein ES703_50078 [subsurface metagenome]